MISYSEAFDRVMEQVPEPRVEELPLVKSRGRRLAAEIFALEDLPPFNRSPLDGYALKASSTSGASRKRPCALDIKGSIAAGEVCSFEIQEGQALRIMTGAAIPRGADCVIRQEDVELEESVLLLFTELKEGQNIVKKGEDVQRGRHLFSPGRKLVSSDIGLLAALGFSRVPVFSSPRVAILSTGSELVPVSDIPGPGKIRNSNSCQLAALVEEYGGESFPGGIAADSLEEICPAVENMLENADILLTTGGVSVGDHDLLPEALRRMGARCLFWKVAMKPGTPMLVAEKKGKLIFALSGNPAACLISFDQFVGPALLKMQGAPACSLPLSRGILQGDLDVKKSAHLRFVRAEAALNDLNILEVIAAGNQKPGVLSSFCRFNCYIPLLPGEPLPRAGDPVTVQLLPRLFGRELQIGQDLLSLRRNEPLRILTERKYSGVHNHARLWPRVPARGMGAE